MREGGGRGRNGKRKRAELRGWAGRRERKREKAPNKNTNRNKVGFAFDKHRKKAQRKVITYTTACPDYGLRLFLPRSLFFLFLCLLRGSKIPRLP